MRDTLASDGPSDDALLEGTPLEGTPLDATLLDGATNGAGRARALAASDDIELKTARSLDEPEARGDGAGAAFERTLELATAVGFEAAGLAATGVAMTPGFVGVTEHDATRDATGRGAGASSGRSTLRAALYEE